MIKSSKIFTATKIQNLVKRQKIHKHFNFNASPLSNKFYLQDNYNVLHIAAMYSREDVVKLLLNKRGVDPFSTGGVSIIKLKVNSV